MHDLFALTDEQILEIEPEGEVNVAPPTLPAQAGFRAGSSPAGPSEVAENAGLKPSATQNSNEPTALPSEASNASSPASSATASGPFSAPEDVRALAELYPGGVTQARSAAERARTLDEIDAAYFGAAGTSPDQVNAARAQLAQRMLHEDPAAFREMVFAGLRALEDVGRQPGAASVGARSSASPSAVGATLRSPVADGGKTTGGGASPAPAGPSAVGAQHAAPLQADPWAPNDGGVNQATIAAYTAFEEAANEDLERSIGGAIARTIEQALPNVSQDGRGPVSGRPDRVGAPLQARLSAGIREDVEAALKGDRQLSEQIAQILAGRRFDNETRAQVVRLIDERARQLVPAAAKRVISDWTQTTLAAHRGKSERTDAASARREVVPASVQGANSATASSRAAQARPGTEPHRNASRSDARRVDYRKLSDEQILDL